MFRKKTMQSDRLADSQGKLAAIDKSQAVIEFDLQGNILTANENFLALLGYRLEEIKGRSHGMLAEPSYRQSDAYRLFWEKLRRGEYDTGQYKHIGKDGREVWIQASYNPILDAQGKPYKVVTFASDVTAQVNLAQQMHHVVSQTQEVIKSASSGDLSRRVDTTSASGEVLKMAEAVNFLLATVTEMFGDVQEVIMAATEGDLTGRVATEGKTGDLGKMALSVNVLLESVGSIISNVKGASSAVLGGAEEISHGTLDLQQRTEQQSSSLEQTAASMEEMTQTVKQNADNAGQANQLAIAARGQAEKGGLVVGQAVEAMSKINEASKKIADIIGVIDEIAFQTNLLALNAAVEAARAGEQGRGFAVVATEVRSLAGRSAVAAKEIKDLIKDSVRKVEDGSTLVTQSGQTLSEIVTSVKKVSDIVAEIAAASREQSAGIEQVNQAVMHMDEMTQQNAALVEEATAVSQSMAEQARQLATLMARYNSRDSDQRLIPVVEPWNPSGAVSGAAETRGAVAAVRDPVERRPVGRPWKAKGAAAGRRGAIAASAGGASIGARGTGAPGGRVTGAHARDAGATGAGMEGAGARGTSEARARSSKGVANGSDADWLEF
ncbi:MAG: methyl-accepting chemotaxis protein [Steroidobacteraceae bacterium]